MPGTEIKAAFIRLIEDVYNKNDLALIPELVSPDFIVHTVPGYGGHDGLREHIVETRKSFPDVHFTVNQIVAEGEMVAWLVTMEGTNTGEFMGGAPTCKKVSYPAIGISRMANGREVERWQMANPLVLFQQLGITSPNYKNQEQ